MIASSLRRVHCHCCVSVDEWYIGLYWACVSYLFYFVPYNITIQVGIFAGRRI